MADVHQFAYGWVTPALAYAVSVLGSLLGLVCTGRAGGAKTPAKRAGWLTLAAVSIGGTGIWLMHFLAMIGFTIDGTEIRFDIGETLLSALLAIVVVGVGLAILGTGRPRVYRVLLGGLITGLGVAGMHYTGMAAMRVDGTVGYNPTLVALSVVIAVVAATAALWFTIVARSFLLITGAALIMGVAVNGMHYVGMFGSEVTLDSHHSASDGVDVQTALPIIAGLAGIVVIVLLYAALSIPTEEEFMPRFSGEAPDQPVESSLWTSRTTIPAQRTAPASGASARRSSADTGAPQAPSDFVNAREPDQGDPWSRG